MTTKRSSWPVRPYAVLLGLIALALLAGGIWLATLGGSLYYVLAGLVLALSSVLVWRRRREGMWLYAALFAVTLAWSIWEVGLTPWALMPRIVAWAVVGAWMLTPWFRRALLPTERRLRWRLDSWAGLGGALAAAVAVGAVLHPLHGDPFDPRFQTGFGPYPATRQQAATPTGGEWQHWGNDQGGARFSGLTQITPENVGQLEVAWRAPISDTEAGRNAGLEVTPLMVGGALYSCSGVNEVVATDAETGKRLWRVDTAGSRGRTCRGVAYYRVPAASGLCAERIITATGNASLIALDRRTGAACPRFGSNGTVNLLEGLSKAPQGYYYVTSAPAVIRGKVVLGGWVSDGQYVGEPSGVIRAFDAVTGKLSWAWDMGRPDRTGAPAPGETYTPGTPNSWAPISADETLGMVYIPTGNATPDYVGTHRRPFDERYSSSIVALDAQTGRPRWSFQTVHHDLWDYDVAAQPALADLPQPGGSVIPALVQVTKRGEVYVLDRRTGRPVHRVVEQPVPQAGKVPEERLSPTQPFSVAMPSFRNPKIVESDMWGITPLDQIYCRIKFRQARFEGTMTPPGLTPHISSPGYVGGSDWGGTSIDADHGVMIVNSAKLANYVRLITRQKADERGIKPTGDGAKAADVGGAVAQLGTNYAAEPAPFLSPLGVPCQAPPYGYLSAVDLVTGKLIWSQPLGTARDSGPLGIRARVPLPLGTPTTGGPMTTRTGIAFIGATADRTFRAFDVRTGKQLWQHYLSSSAYANPMTYISPKSGRQFVVVAAGGSHGLGATGTAELVAFALPDKRK